MALSAVTTKRVATIEQSPLLPAAAAIVRLPQRTPQLDRLHAMAREAVAIAESSDSPVWQGDAVADLTLALTGIALAITVVVTRRRTRASRPVSA